MSAYFDGGADIAGRRLREVEVIYVHDPTLNLGGDDSDDCPPSPPPTYYLRVREEASRGRNKVKHGAIDTQGWSWRYVNVEKKALLVWDRRGGRLLRTIPLKEVETLRVIPDEEAPASILEVHTTASPSVSADVPPPPPPNGENQGEGEKGDASQQDGRILVLQARSRTETLLWAKVLQENVQLMTKRLVPLENLDVESNLSDVQQLAKLLTHQLSELQSAEGCERQKTSSSSRQDGRKDGELRHSDSCSGNGTLERIVEAEVQLPTQGDGAGTD